MSESVNEFIQRKNIQFEKEKVSPKQKVKMKDIGRKGKLCFKREAWTFLPQTNLDKKVFVFERFRKLDPEGEHAYKQAWNKGDIEYRIGYYIVGKIGHMNGKWTWGQYCPIIPEKDLSKLLQKALKEKVIVGGIKGLISI